MSERANIDELLNGFVDGEISDRQATEVKRLMLHDPAIAARVERIRRQRQLLGALPVDSAPADMAGTVRSMLERRTLLEAASAGKHHVLGSMHLFGRKLAAVAAMLALLGGLGYLVYTVIGPERSAGKADIVTIARKPAPDRAAPAGDKTVAAATSIELVLRTDSPTGLNSVVQKAINSCGLLDSATVDRQPLSTAYSLACDKENMTRVLGEISSVWDKVKEKSMTIASPGEEAVTIRSVTIAQVAAVIASPDLPSRMASARQFAEVNTREPGAGTVTILPNGGQDELKIPKPSLTSPEFDKAATSSVETRSDKLNFTIKVAATD
jgi:hypothetical protein